MGASYTESDHDLLVPPGASSSKSKARRLAAALAISLATVALVAGVYHSTGSNAPTELAILGEDGRPLVGTSTAGMPADNPMTGHTFSRILQMCYECVEELKRSLRGLPQRDYDAEAKVSFIETMIGNVVYRLKLQKTIPPPQLWTRGASFDTAVYKVRVLDQVVHQLPEQGYFRIRDMRDVRYTVLRYDFRQIAQAMTGVVESLHWRKFKAWEPDVPHYVQAQRRIEASVNTHTSEPSGLWLHIGQHIQKHLDRGMPLRSRVPQVMMGRRGQNHRNIIPGIPPPLPRHVPVAIIRHNEERDKAEQAQAAAEAPPSGGAPVEKQQIVQANNPSPQVKFEGSKGGYEIDLPQDGTKPVVKSLTEEGASKKTAMLFIGSKNADGQLDGTVVPMDAVQDAVDKGVSENLQGKKVSLIPK